MLISAKLLNTAVENQITVETSGNSKRITFPAKTDGPGSSINGGELLLLALATCFCNDIYREAGRRKLHIESIEVNVTGRFEKEGEPGTDIQYEASIISHQTSPEELADLIKYVDSIAEIHNTIRRSATVYLKGFEINEHHTSL